MELIHYVAEKISAERQAQLEKAANRSAMLHEIKYKKTILKKYFAFTIWNFEITVTSARKQPN